MECAHRKLNKGEAGRERGRPEKEEGYQLIDGIGYGNCYLTEAHKIFLTEKIILFTSRFHHSLICNHEGI